MKYLAPVALALAMLLTFARSESRPLDGIAYDGLLYARMQTIVGKLRQRGDYVVEAWHDHTVAGCPRYLVGHSMGGDAALAQAASCAAAGHPPKVVVSIDPGGAPQNAHCTKGVKCINYYNPDHPIGGEYVTGATNIIVRGYDHLNMPLAPQIIAGTLAATALPPPPPPVQKAAANDHDRVQRWVDGVRQLLGR